MCAGKSTADGKDIAGCKVEGKATDGDNDGEINNSSLLLSELVSSLRPLLVKDVPKAIMMINISTLINMHVQIMYFL